MRPINQNYHINESNVKNYYRLLSSKYDSIIDQSFLYQLQERISYDTILKFIPKANNIRILDIGGGTGRISINLAKRGYSIIVLDVSKEMLDIAKCKAKMCGVENKLEFLNISMNELRKIKLGKFDFIIANNSLSYLYNFPSVLNEIVYMLNNNCYIFASFENRYFRMKSYFYKRKINRKTIIHFENFLNNGVVYHSGYDSFLKREIDSPFCTFAYTPQKIKDLFEENNIKIIELYTNPIICEFFSNEELSKNCNIKFFEYFLKLEYQCRKEKSCLFFGRNIDVVGKKD